MRKTLDENGVKDDTPEFDQVTSHPHPHSRHHTLPWPRRTPALNAPPDTWQLNIDEDFYTPVLHLYFSDDLTIA